MVDDAPARRLGDKQGDQSYGYCQSKFYTACSRTRARWSSTVFAHELPLRSTGFDAENRLYLFALTVPSGRFDAQRRGDNWRNRGREEMLKRNGGWRTGRRSEMRAPPTVQESLQVGQAAGIAKRAGSRAVAFPSFQRRAGQVLNPLGVVDFGTIVARGRKVSCRVHFFIVRRWKPVSRTVSTRLLPSARRVLTRSKPARDLARRPVSTRRRCSVTLGGP